jgi:subtilisin family serine protease
MPRYLVRPKAGLSSRSPSLVSRSFKAAARDLQVKHLAEFRGSHPVYDELRRWVRDAESRGVKALSGMEHHHTPITGTKVLELTKEEVEKLLREVTDVEVIPDRRIELIQPQRVTASNKTALESDDAWHLQAIALDKLRSTAGFEGRGEGVTAAVLDTGVEAGHPEIEGRVSRAVTFDVDKWDAEEQSPSRDTDGHGTHVTGLFCGKTVGVAPAAKVVNGVMLPGGFGQTSNFILAMEWAGTQPEIQLVNMSGGLPGYLPEMTTAVAGLLAAGVFPVVAIGNEGRNQTRSPGNYVEVLSVGASTRENKVASFSGGGTITAESHSYQVPDLVAPGEQVYSCVMSGGYEAWNGTSMATPIVAGIAALLLEKHPDVTVTDLREEVLMSCMDLGLEIDRQGEGLIQVKLA